MNTSSAGTATAGALVEETIQIGMPTVSAVACSASRPLTSAIRHSAGLRSAPSRCGSRLAVSTCCGFAAGRHSATMTAATSDASPLTTNSTWNHEWLPAAMTGAAASTPTEKPTLRSIPRRAINATRASPMPPARA